MAHERRDRESRGAPRVIVAAVGNVLRHDDGFGAAVAARLGDLPAGVELLETGIGGITILQELLAGCDGLLIVDTAELHAPPGTVAVLEPELDPAAEVTDLHLATPERVLALAKALGCLPPRVAIVGCQPALVDEPGIGLSPPVERAVGPAAEAVRLVVRGWLRD